VLKSGLSLEDHLKNLENSKWWKGEKTKARTKIKTIARIMGNILH
jgi:hypothetical protein